MDRRPDRLEDGLDRTLRRCRRERRCPEDRGACRLAGTGRQDRLEAAPADRRRRDALFFKKYAQASVKSFAGAYSGGFTHTCKIARTPGGTWYGNCLAQPNQPGLESIGIYGKYSGGKWGGRVAEFGVDNDDALFFPSSVLSQLQL